jgi:hypothetical protein
MILNAHSVSSLFSFLIKNPQYLDSECAAFIEAKTFSETLKKCGKALELNDSCIKTNIEGIALRGCGKLMLCYGSLMQSMWYFLYRYMEFNETRSQF